MKIALCGIFKNEAPYIIEWIAHHRLMGIKYFIIANNDSTDESELILSKLQKKGYVNYFNFSAPPNQPPQLLAYKKIIDLYSKKYDWMGFIDADEFIVNYSSSENFIDKLFEFHVDEEIGSVVLNWAVYGSNGAIYYEDKPVTQRFFRRALPDFSVNHHYKTFFKTSCLISVGSNPHFFEIDKEKKIVHINGDLVLNHDIGKGLSQSIIWSPFRINHYVIKSKEEFLLKKLPNGSAASMGRKKGVNFFLSHDKNDVFDRVSKIDPVSLNKEIERIEADISLEKEPYHKFGKSLLDFKEFFYAKACLDYCTKKDDGWGFGGWCSLLGGDDVKLFLQFQNYVLSNFEYSLQERNDVFKKSLSETKNCGFNFTVKNTLMLKYGIPKKIIFKNDMYESIIDFNDKYGIKKSIF